MYDNVCEYIYVYMTYIVYINILRSFTGFIEEIRFLHIHIFNLVRFMYIIIFLFVRLNWPNPQGISGF